MSKKGFVSAAALAAVTGLGGSVALADIVIPTVPIGHAGNAADPLTGGLYGSVAYSYNIGQTEVTNAQYTAFLNAKAASDPFGLYYDTPFNYGMGGTYGGITRSGSDGSFTYATMGGRANNPVNFVSFWDACRFVNWLHNGQGNGDTETGAYTLTPDGIANNTVARNAGAQWAVTSEDEWHKAAYHQPAGTGGDSDNYWLYPTQSNSISTSQANYGNGIDTMPVGSYAANYYGTFDMGGNVWEWNEALVFSNARGISGGSFDNFDNALRADFRDGQGPAYEDPFIGFRVSQVPGPGSVALLAIGGLATARRRR